MTEKENNYSTTAAICLGIAAMFLGVAAMIFAAAIILLVVGLPLAVLFYAIKSGSVLMAVIALLVAVILWS